MRDDSVYSIRVIGINCQEDINEILRAAKCRITRVLRDENKCYEIYEISKLYLSSVWLKAYHPLDVNLFNFQTANVHFQVH